MLGIEGTIALDQKQALQALHTPENMLFLLLVLNSVIAV